MALRSFSGALSISLVFIASLSAQSSLSLAEAVALALREHPALAAGSDRIAATEGLKQQAGLQLNPRLILQSENARPYGNPGFVYMRDSDNFAYLQQTLETAGKRERRVDVAAANITRAQLERELTERQIATRVKQAYWLALGAQRAVELLAQDTKSFAGIIEYHVIRVREGAMAEADLIRVRLEGQRLELALNSARLDAERFRIHLFREMGRKEFPTIRFAEQLEMLPVLPDATDIPAALDRRPEVRLARQIIAVARSNSRLQQSGAKPNVEVLFGYKRTAGFDTMLGGFQMDLPFHNRNQGNIAAAVAEIRMAESTLAATEALVKAEIEAAARDAQLRQRQAGEAIQTMRTQADEAARIAEAAYREGGADLLRLIDAQRLRTETQLLHARILAEFHQSISALESALGVNP